MSVRDDTLRKVFADEMKHIVKNNEAFINKVEKSVMNALKQTTKKTDTFVTAKKEIENITRKKHNIVDLYLENTISKEDLQSIVNEYDKQINIVNLRIKQPQNDCELIANPLAATEKIKNIVKNIACGDFFSEEVCREILDCIAVYSDTRCKDKERGFDVRLMIS